MRLIRVNSFRFASNKEIGLFNRFNGTFIVRMRSYRDVVADEVLELFSGKGHLIVFIRFRRTVTF